MNVTGISAGLGQEQQEEQYSNLHQTKNEPVEFPTAAGTDNMQHCYLC